MILYRILLIILAIDLCFVTISTDETTITTVTENIDATNLESITLETEPIEREGHRYYSLSYYEKIDNLEISIYDQYIVFKLINANLNSSSPSGQKSK